jgi:YNFM family putative membrane transporter
MALILIVSVLTFFVIYGPQPLLPLLAETYLVSRSEAALLITVVMVPLSLAPVTYGYVLEAMPAMRLLRLSVLGLAISTLAFGLATAFGWLITLRVLQGILLPAVLTSLMTYISAQSEPQQLQRRLSAYIAATILGGYLGRLLSGLSATFFNWHTFFLWLGVALLLCVVLLSRRQVDVKIYGARPTPRQLGAALQTGPYVRVYAIIFCMFLVFAATMNFLPFRLVELWGDPSELLTGLMYTGYMVGLATSLGSSRIIRRVGSEQRVLRIAISVFLIAVASTAFVGGWGLFGLLFAVCGAMFLVHATAAGWLNRLAAENKGIVNGVYISAYYTGGVVGSYVPGLIYQQYGWLSFVAGLTAVAGVALLIAWLQQPATSHQSRFSR